MNSKQLMSWIVSFVAYWIFLGWKMALLIVFAIGFHESCHLWMAKRHKLPTGGFYLVPFIGGVALMTGRYKSLWQQAQVVLAGPLGGGLMACAFSGVYFLTGSPIIGASAILMLLLNAFNLLPLSFMDGGQLVGTLTYSMSRGAGLSVKIVSTLVAAVLLLWVNPLIAGFIILFGGMELNGEIRNYKNFKAGRRWLVPDTYLYPPTSLTKKQVAATICGHIGTAVLLMVVTVYTIYGMHATSEMAIYNVLK